MQNPLRRKLNSGDATYGMWVTLESPSVTEAAVALGLDWIVIEMEHGHLDWRNVLEHIRVCSATDTAAIVRIPEIQRSFIQRTLDLGADGIILPMVGDAQQLETAFKFGRFPPAGVRGVGGERSVKWGLDWEGYLQSANAETLIIPLLETKDATENVDKILAVTGLETIFFGPADMSASFGHLGEWEGPGVAKAILNMRAKAEASGIASGILARTPEEAGMRRDQGFQMIGLGADVNLILRSLRETLDFLK